jgi:hypothetical protein
VSLKVAIPLSPNILILSVLAVCSIFVNINVAKAQSNTTVSVKRMFEESSDERNNQAFTPSVSTIGSTFQISAKNFVVNQIVADNTNYNPKKMAVGVYTNGQSKLDSLYVSGEEQKGKVISFQSWLFPVDKITQVTGLQTQITDRKVKVFRGNQVAIIPLTSNPDESYLGQAVSIKDLLTIPGINIKFDPQKYSIDFTLSPTTSPPENQFAQRIPSPVQPRFIPSRLLVGLNINDRSKLEGFYVWGQENGSDAVDFDNWLLPFDEFSQALGWRIKEVGDQLEISASGQRFRLPSNKVIIDNNVGRAIAVRDINAIPGYTVKFDIFKYAINVTLPSAVNGKFTVLEPPVVLDGLDVVRPPGLGVSIIQQRLNSSGSTNNSVLSEPQGELQVTGNIADAGWYLRFNQPNITNISSWNLSEAVVVRQNKKDDQILGVQSPFWRYRNVGVGSYWGGTYVHRNGFEAPVRFSGGNYSLNERLQARRSSRTISGTVEPGTLVQLVKNDRTQLLQEVLVDSSGIYRFDNVVVSGNFDDTSIGREYQVLLYPRGQLTANPIIRDVTFTTFAGQIPIGADAFVISAGADRISSGNFGTFGAVQGGVLYRRGLTESLTAGVGFAYDRELRGVGEFFWQPSKPLEITAAVTTGSDVLDYVGRLSYRPSQDFYLSSNVDRFSSNANSYWRLGKNFATIGGYDSIRGPFAGAEYFDAGPNRSTRLQADIDLKGRTRINASQRLDEFQATYLGNESADALQITYAPTGNGAYGSSNQEFVVGYQAGRQVTNSALTSALWRYRSPDRTADGRNLWQTELGYGFNSFGSGLLANVDLNFLSGLQLRASYRGINDASSQGSYAIELTTTLFTGNGIRGTYDRVEDFRNLGKIVFQPFLDKNQNGRQDNGEESYWDPQLIRLNEKPIDRFRPQVNNNQGDINLPNGSYRIDIDPAGYPINYRSRLDALRADVTSGGVTTIAIPLVQSYSMVGFVKDTKGDAIPGGRVEALNLRTKAKIISITNDSGFYTLEGLEQDEYKITVSDLATTPNNIKIAPNSPPQQEINLTIKIPE